ncbi:MAG: hypothetical protein J7465_08600 [Chloroflexus sp.]|jgi:hypothetical protein|nr:hypothetical protein [Chloroflexus sp.]MBO9375068.1 hypothetical protein [Chloroflexus sp.]
MTATCRIPHVLPQPPLTGTRPLSAETGDTTWPLALKALLLLNGAISPSDPVLTTLSDDELIALRGSLLLLQSDEPTNVA